MAELRADHRRARGHPGRRRPAARRHQGRDGRDPGQVRHAPPGRDHLRRRRHRHRGPHRRRGPRRHHDRPGLRQDGRRPTPSAPRAAAAAAWPAPSCKDEDCVNHIIHTTAHAYLLFFSNRGRVYRLRGPRDPDEGAHGAGHGHRQPAAAAAGRAHPGHHRHPRLRDRPLPVLRHPHGPGQEDHVHRVRHVAAGRAHRHQPARRRRAGRGHPDQRRRRHLHGQPRRA